MDVQTVFKTNFYKIYTSQPEGIELEYKKHIGMYWGSPWS